MNPALLVNLLGFAVGVALYLMLAIMVVRHRRDSRADNADVLLLMTAALGVLWNAGELYAFAQKDLALAAVPPIITALSFSALGFLPSVVVHSARQDGEGTVWLPYAAYTLSTVTAAIHVQSVFAGTPVPSFLALQLSTFGSLALAAGLLIFNFRQTIEKKAIFAAALLIFAVSALHLSGEREGIYWYIELLAHQSSLPLALVILYQNYRFAFADLFLKRAISLLLITAIALGLYVTVAVPLLRYHESHDRDDVQAAALVIGLWVATAMLYPSIYRLAVWLVDRVILNRADYAKLQRLMATAIEADDDEADVLTTLTSRLSVNLTAAEVRSESVAENATSPLASVEIDRGTACVRIPTAEAPQYDLVLSQFAGGRKLLSEEISLLSSSATVAARRIDAIRVSHERFEQRFREQEFEKLATEAQLTALRSQINPHFLFNALTTLGYLIKTSPDKAYDTLLRLTQLLRGVLKSTGEFTTLAAEIELIRSYLDIESARFEEKLAVEFEVDESTETSEVPSLILQPLVENAIKHGISENRSGGTIRISAGFAGSNGGETLKLAVWDSGAGKRSKARSGGEGVGLRNIRGRLQSYYGGDAAFTIRSESDGTLAEVSIPVGKKPGKKK